MLPSMAEIIAIINLAMSCEPTRHPFTDIQITDKGHNLRIYYANDPMLTNATFQLR